MAIRPGVHIVTVFLIGQDSAVTIVSIFVALTTVGIVLFVAVRCGKALSRLVAHQSDEVILFTYLAWFCSSLASCNVCKCQQ